jgi:hypothetical protein
VLAGPRAFEFVANSACLHLEDLGDPHWVRDSLQALDTLLAHDLRVRERRKFFGGLSGALWIPRRPDAWRGDLWAWLGFGHTMVFRDWFGRGLSDTPNTSPASALARRPVRLADSVQLGAASLVLMVGSAWAILSGLPLDHPLVTAGMATWGCGAPAAAAMNVAFAMRDSQRGHPAQAALGLCLSALVLLLATVPLLFAN